MSAQSAHRPQLRIIDGFVDEPLLRALRAVCADEALWPPSAQVHRGPDGLVVDLPLSAHPALEVLAGRLIARFDLDTHLGPPVWRLHRCEIGQGRGPVHDAHEVGGLRRYASAMVHVEAPEAGGQSRWPESGPQATEIVPRSGRLAIWRNYLGDVPDPGACHEVLPVRGGVRTTLTWHAYGPPEPVAPTLHWVVDPARPAPAMVRALEAACSARSIGAVEITPRSMDPTTGPLAPGSMLLCVSDTALARYIERQCFGPQVATLHHHPQGPLWAPCPGAQLLDWADVPTRPRLMVHRQMTWRAEDLVTALGGLPVRVLVPASDRALPPYVVPVTDVHTLEVLLRQQLDAAPMVVVESGAIPLARHRLRVIDGVVIGEVPGTEDQHTLLTDLAVRGAEAMGWTAACVDVIVIESGDVLVECVHPLMADVGAEEHMPLAEACVDHLLSRRVHLLSAVKPIALGTLLSPL
ncbi:MAG: 2OG-Fe(II) oxygenase [Bradymonadia bacterium]